MKRFDLLKILLPCILITNTHSWVSIPHVQRPTFELFGSKLRGVACSGIRPEELGVIQQALTFSCQEQMVPFDISELKLLPPNTASIIGSTGRVLLMEFQGGTKDEAADLTIAISQELDEVMFELGTLKHPILVSLQTNVSKKKHSKEFVHTSLDLAQIVEDQIQEYELKVPLPQAPKLHTIPIPTMQIEVDGAMIQHDGKDLWDTSSIIVFDDLVSDDLRSRLLDVVNGKDFWDDVANGPNPSRWMRGGLVDMTDQEEEEEEEEVDRSFGLSEDGIDELCFQHHDAIQDFETILTSLFSNFVVSRLPEAVFGSVVSPMTANAPTYEDTTSFQYHIDGDPNQAPPSLWTDIFGRYPNRAPGKPRFMSCLVYLNGEWRDEWGAPTRFLDVRTNTPVDILPKPGRIVLMDQDITHKVTAPNDSAGKRPRYSLVWKLILHPRDANQDMKQICGKGVSPWPEPKLIGSAQNNRV